MTSKAIDEVKKKDDQDLISDFIKIFEVKYDTSRIEIYLLFNEKCQLITYFSEKLKKIK